MALNRTGKSVDKSAIKNQIDTAKASPDETTQSPQAVAKQMSETQNNINFLSGILMENENRANPMKKLNANEIEKTKQMLQKDVAQYNNDIKLLSLLVGRPLTGDDLSKLASTNLGKSSLRLGPSVTPTTTTITTQRHTLRATQAGSNTIPAFKPLTDQESKFLQALEQIQTTRAPTTTSTTTERLKTVSKSQEAIIAALLRQQGFGPNNQIPIEVNFKQ